MSQENCKTNHNQRCRYTNGFYCEDCHTFFHKDSPTYRSSELLSSIWMVLNNINVDLYRDDKEKDPEITKLMDEIGLEKTHKNYEELIAKAEVLTSKHGAKSSDGDVVLGGEK